jgi:hypothetical protein
VIGMSASEFLAFQPPTAAGIETDLDLEREIKAIILAHKSYHLGYSQTLSIL